MTKKFEDMPVNVQQTVLGIIRCEFAQSKIENQGDADAVVTIAINAISKLYEDDCIECEGDEKHVIIINNILNDSRKE